MCDTCGCSDASNSSMRITDLGESKLVNSHQHDHAHPHGTDNGHDHGHDHPHQHGDETAVDLRPSRTIRVEQELLAKNDLVAARNRGWLEGRGILALNLMSSPGAGKTTLLERTLSDMAKEVRISVVEGDQETVRDAERIRAAGARAIQINTGSGCHLDAQMIFAALLRLSPPAHSVVMIENVGNLVCPALFDLGEAEKVVIISATEGEDKPLKYPHMFRAAGLMLLNKIDLIQHLDFDIDQCCEYARQVNPNIEIMLISARTGDGMDRWYRWLRAHVERLEADPAVPA
ncbi:MAG: hydrogenase nickel incorporation protein HypB [Candidatus Binataceae bacterium]